MNAEIKAQWVAALRSGEYKQGKAALRIQDRFCCLGVLCDLHSKTFNTPWEVDPHACELRYHDEARVLPYEVIEWAGLPDFNPNIGDGCSLAEYNDRESKSFEYIANLIENNL